MTPTPTPLTPREVAITSIETLRRYGITYVPGGFRDDAGDWHDGPHRARFMAALRDLEALALGEVRA